MLKRVCPNCNKELTYKNAISFERQVKINGWCKSCSFLKKRNKTKTHNIEKLLNGTNEAYYWVGFIFADGYISENLRLKITLAIKDYDHLIKFCKFINVDKSKIRITSKHCSICIMDTNVVKTIITVFDFKDKKTYNPPDLNVLFTNKTKEQIYSFIAGYIDGDGCIRNQTKRPDFLLQIKVHNSWLQNLKLIANYIGKNCSVKINRQGYTLLLNSNSQDLIPLKQIILSLNIPYLKRKWNVINENFMSKYVKAEQKKKDFFYLIKQNKNRKEIANILNVSQSWITNILKL